jgi:hypothetical protein
VVDRSLPASAWSGSSRKARRRRRQRTR